MAAGSPMSRSRPTVSTYTSPGPPSSIRGETARAASSSAWRADSDVLLDRRSRQQHRAARSRFRLRHARPYALRAGRGVRLDGRHDPGRRRGDSGARPSPATFGRDGRRRESRTASGRSRSAGSHRSTAAASKCSTRTQAKRLMRSTSGTAAARTRRGARGGFASSCARARAVSARARARSTRFPRGASRRPAPRSTR